MHDECDSVTVVRPESCKRKEYCVRLLKFSIHCLSYPFEKSLRTVIVIVASSREQIIIFTCILFVVIVFSFFRVVDRKKVEILSLSSEKKRNEYNYRFEFHSQRIFISFTFCILLCWYELYCFHGFTSKSKPNAPISVPIVLQFDCKKTKRI